MMEFDNYDEVERYCEEQRDSDRFCRISCACSGPSYCNNGKVLAEYGKEGFMILSGGTHDGCVFRIPR